MSPEDPQLELQLAPKRKRKIEFREPLIVLCEGLADREFFRKLLSTRKIRSFEVPFPHDPSLDENIEKDQQIAGEKTRFGAMLQAIKFSETTKAVLLVLDSADDIAETFVQGCGFIREADQYNIPAKLMELAPANGDIPAVAIATVPCGQVGGLEIPCYEALIRNHQELAECIEVLCQRSDVKNWNPEKQGKARLQCGIAVLNKEDPNKSLRRIFERTTPIIPLDDIAFDSIEAMLRDFAKLAGLSV
jgi:hypothetical protein